MRIKKDFWGILHKTKHNPLEPASTFFICKRACAPPDVFYEEGFKLPKDVTGARRPNCLWCIAGNNGYED
jgi:hypothetical protein